jgi:hypothetical protein
MATELETWLAARPTRNPVIETVRDTFDGYDAWGSTMEWWFAIADVIAGIDASQIPSEWEFRQSPMGADIESYAYQEIVATMCSGATLEDLLAAGNILFRYAAQLKLEGMDY